MSSDTAGTLAAEVWMLLPKRRLIWCSSVITSGHASMHNVEANTKFRWIFVVTATLQFRLRTIRFQSALCKTACKATTARGGWRASSWDNISFPATVLSISKFVFRFLTLVCRSKPDCFKQCPLSRLIKNTSLTRYGLFHFSGEERWEPFIGGFCPEWSTWIESVWDQVLIFGS
jgi:hypothetical protein